MRTTDLKKGLELINSGQKDLTIDLSNYSLGPDGTIALAEALNSGKCPTGLTLDLPGNRFGPEGATTLANALKSGQCPTDLILNLSDNSLGSAGVKAIAEALESGKCPEGLTLNLGRNRLETADVTVLAKALTSLDCPEGLTLDLSDNNLGGAGATILAGALKSGFCPEGLTLKLENNALESAGAGALAEALKSRRCPKDLTLHLGDNNLEHADALIEALILNPGVRILGLDNFPLVKRASQLAQHIALLWQAGNDKSKVNAAYSKIVEIIKETPKLLVNLIRSALTTTQALDNTEAQAYKKLINALINQLELKADLKNQITEITANTEFEDAVASSHKPLNQVPLKNKILKTIGIGFAIGVTCMLVTAVVGGVIAATGGSAIPAIVAAIPVLGFLTKMSVVGGSFSFAAIATVGAFITAATLGAAMKKTVSFLRQAIANCRKPRDKQVSGSNDSFTGSTTNQITAELDKQKTTTASKSNGAAPAAPEKTPAKVPPTVKKEQSQFRNENNAAIPASDQSDEQPAYRSSRFG